MHAMPHPSISPRTAECGKVSGAQPQLPLASGVGIAAIVEVLGVAVGVVPEVLRGARDGAAVAAEEAAHLGAGPEEDVPQRALIDGIDRARRNSAAEEEEEEDESGRIRADRDDDTRRRIPDRSRSPPALPLPEAEAAWVTGRSSRDRLRRGLIVSRIASVAILLERDLRFDSLGLFLACFLVFGV